MDKNWTIETLNRMSLEEKVGQLLMVFFYDIDSIESHNRIISEVQKYNLGGVFHSSLTKESLVSFSSSVQKAAKIPVLIAGDYECGPGWVVDGALRVSRPMTRGNAGDTELEYNIGKCIAKQGRAIGSTVTFSPVIDLNTNRLNPDVNIRAYGEDVDTVCNLAVPYIKGIQENGMLGCVKHFPGNGATDMDQHICTAIINCSREEMYENFLEAYKRTFKEADPAFVMVAHLEVPSLTTEINPKNGRVVPSSVSKEIVTDILKKELGFKGVAISDALNMGGITTHYSRQEVAVKSILAGIDMLLVFNPDDFYLEYDALLNAAKEGIIPIERIDDAVTNILNAKVKAGLNVDMGLPFEDSVINELFTPGKYDKLSVDAISRGITLLRNRDNVLPIKDIKGKKVIVLSTFNPDEETLTVQGQELIVMRDKTPELLRKRGAEVQEYNIPLHMTVADIYEIIGKAKEADYVFFNFFIAPSWGIGTLIPNKSSLRFLCSDY
ncbi:glycoside hydrolase family 3 protein [Pseudobacteroides cellulosolvens]|uniref:beta-N-acetylhexosaminidase n=1 Tax=Pseudobacteroides cellulosolvens ATCC 35603 = DSM 2933 TaxID=398512 RepID=A0A0L6JIT1_9FIRM|nr:glycoside hydrolase family 3 N-terminal domain-containing protein [Pseudobacteroides cellulosolvens]KNY25645.1 Beta-N-acetylhexosaminidase [Pseudobacteroides cellulosolvens ATCC 35603 = DSM 2933]